MTENSLSERPVFGRTFSTMMWVVGLIALLQLFAVSLAMIKRSATERDSNRLSEALSPDLTVPLTGVPRVAPEAEGRLLDEVKPREVATMPNSPEDAVPPPPLAPPAPVTTAAPVPRTANPENAGFMGPAEEPPAVGSSLSEVLADAARKNPLVDEPILERLLSTGAELRTSGNMQGALQAFREVETALPAHPRVLSELAATLTGMGLTDKANGYWEKVEELGPLAAGDYLPVAGRQLRGEDPPVPEPVASSPISHSNMMRIGEVKVQEQAATSEGQKVSLRVVVEADPNSRPIGEDLALLVYFYDKVSGGSVQASTADTSYLYPTEPYDWKVDGREEIVVIYHQPVFSEEQRLELGERSYYGYVIELYYRDQIQDKVVMPDDLATRRIEAPTVPQPVEKGLGPENALFPDSPESEFPQ